MAGHVRKRHKSDCARRDDKTKRCNCNGSWQARIPDPARPGGTRKIERTFRTKQEAEDWCATLRTSYLHGTYVDPKQSERPFSDVVDAWYGSWDKRLSPTTAARYRGILDRYLLPEFGHVPIGRISHEIVQRYIDGLAANPELAPGSVRNVYSVFRNAMNRGVRLGMVKTNPCTNIDLPRSPREEMAFLSARQVAAVADEIDPYYRVLIYTAAYMGLRAGELLALRRRDVDLLRGTLTVARSLKEVSGYQTFSDPKTAHSVRTISIPGFLRAMLTEHLSSPLPGGDGPDALIFPSKTGKPLRHTLFYGRHFKPAVRRALPANLHHLRWHDLRHTCAALSIASGAHAKLIAQRLGHSSITITLDRYGHPYESAEQSLGDALDVLYLSASAVRANGAQARA